MIPQRVKRLSVWLRRAHHSRGFGVQSPSAYSFVRYVINEHYPYYSYDLLAAQFKDVDSLTLKKARLLFRVSNYAQAQYWVSPSPLSSVYSAYVCKACLQSEVVSFDYFKEINASVESERVVFYLSFFDLNENTIAEVIARANENTILLVDLLRKSDAQPFWESVQDNEKVSVTFDLYYVGIVFFDKRNKMNYKINF